MCSALFRFARLLAAAMLLLAAYVATAGAQEFKAGSIVVNGPWTRATPAGAKVAAGYMTIGNTGSETDRLVGGSMPRSGRSEIHEMKMDKGVMKMREVVGGVEVKPGKKVEFGPGGYHLMFMELIEPLKQGETVRGQLRFEKAGTMEIEYKVEAVGAKGRGQRVHQGH